MRIILCGAAVGLTALLLGGAMWYGRWIPFAQQWPLFEALRTTAAIIFAVVGAWLAIVYPDRLRLSLGESKKAGEESGERFRRLFTPIAHSTMILGIVLVAGIIVTMARQVPLVLRHVEASRTISFVILVALTLWQVWTVILTLVLTDMIKSQADREFAQTTSMSALRGLASTETPIDTDDDTDPSPSFGKDSDHPA